MKKPNTVSTIDSSCLGFADETALQSICDSAGLKLHGSSAAENFLITAASDDMEAFAVQVLKGRRVLSGYCFQVAHFS